MAGARIELLSSLWATLGPARVVTMYGLASMVVHSIRERTFDWGWLILSAVLLVPCVIWAIVRARRPAVVIDHMGCSASGVDVRWADVALIWIDEVKGPLNRRGAVMVAGWSLASLEYSRRTSFVATETIRRSAWSTGPQDSFAELVRSMTPVTVQVRTGPGREAYLQHLRSGTGLLPDDPQWASSLDAVRPV